MLKIFHISILFTILFIDCFAAETTYDFEVDGIRYVIIDENDVKIAGISDSINPNRQTPEVASFFDPQSCIGCEIHFVESYAPEYHIVPTYLNISESVIWRQVKYNVVRIGAYSMSAVNFTHVRFPSSIKIIDEYAFCGSGIYHIEGLKNVNEIGDHAFDGCFMDKLEIFENVKSIPEFCFNQAWIKELVIRGNPYIFPKSFYFSEIGCITCHGISPQPIDCRNVFLFPSYILLPGTEYGACYYTYLRIPAICFDKYMEAGWNKFVDEHIIATSEHSLKINIATPHSNYTLCVVPNDTNDYEIKITGVCSEEKANITIPSAIEFDGISHNVTEINRNAFYGGHFGNIALPSTIKTIGSYSFAHSDIERIDGLNNINCLGRSIFEESRISSVSFPDSISFIDSYMFSNSHIEKIILNKNIKKIHATAIEKLYVDTLVCLSQVPPSIYADEVLAMGRYEHNDNLYYLYVPRLSIGQYRTAQYFRDFHNILPIEESTEINFVESVNAPVYVIEGNRLMSSTDATIHTIAGQLIARLCPTDSITLPAGVYIVCSGNAVQKIAIK